MAPALFTLLRLVTAALLFWAVGKHPHNYYVLLRWLVFLTGAWGAYRSYQEDFDKWFFVVFHLALVVLFNPFLPFTFEKSFWNFLNVAAGIVIFFSIFVIDSIAAEKFLGSKLGSAFGLALGSIFSVGLFLLGVFIIYLAIDGIMQSTWLWTNGGQINAQITSVRHRVEDRESETQGHGYVDVYDVDYTFTADGKTFYGGSTLDESPIPLNDQEQVSPKDSVGLAVEYQKNNPSNNRAVAAGNKITNQILPALLMAALGLWPLIVGFKGAKKILHSFKNQQPQEP